MTSNKIGGRLLLLTIIVMLAGLVPGMAQAKPKSEAREWCQHYLKKNRNSKCYVVKRGKLCPKKTKRRATFGSLVRGYKTCTPKGESALKKNRKKANAWCKKYRMKTGKKCTVVKRGLACGFGMTRAKTYGRLATGYKTCTPKGESALKKNRKKANAWCKKYRMKTGKKCKVVKRGLPCPIGLIVNKKYGKLVNGFKACTSARDKRKEYRQKAHAWCKRWKKTNKGRCMVMQRISPCPPQMKKGKTFGPVAKGIKTCVTSTTIGNKIKAVAWCKDFTRRYLRGCIVVPRVAPCPPPKIKAKTFGRVATGFKACTPPVAALQMNLGKARRFCKKYQRKTGRVCRVVKRGAPCFPPSKRKATFGTIATGFKACVR